MKYYVIQIIQIIKNKIMQVECITIIIIDIIWFLQIHMNLMKIIIQKYIHQVEWKAMEDEIFILLIEVQEWGK